jgi:2'-5' RNA ligase
MATLRTFIALGTPDEFRVRIGTIQEMMKQSPADVRWEPADKFHATIKFLGGVEEQKLSELGSKIKETLVPFGRVQVTFDAAGFFPHLRRPRVVWVGAKTTDPALLSIKQKLDETLAPMGFEIDSREFHPHITLGRIKSTKEINHLISIVESLRFEPFTATMGEVLLMKSILRPEGSHYSTLETYTLHS